MKPAPIFTVKPEHIALLRRLYIREEDGVPTVDCKRPFGNSDVAGDVHEILGWPEDDRCNRTDDRAYTLVEELATVLQILTLNLAIEPGDYQQTDYYNYQSWRKVGGAK